MVFFLSGTNWKLFQKSMVKNSFCLKKVIIFSFIGFPRFLFLLSIAGRSERCGAARAGARRCAAKPSAATGDAPAASARGEGCGVVVRASTWGWSSWKGKQEIWPPPKRSRFDMVWSPQSAALALILEVRAARTPLTPGLQSRPMRPGLVIGPAALVVAYLMDWKKFNVDIFKDLENLYGRPLWGLWGFGLVASFQCEEENRAEALGNIQCKLVLLILIVPGPLNIPVL